MTEKELQRFADLVVGFGANVQPGQIVALGTEPGKERLTRALAASAYRAGAKFVDVSSFDLHVKRARIEYAAPDTLEFVPDWYGQRILALGDQRCARIGLSGPVAPGLLDDLDPKLVGRDQLPFLPETGQVVNDSTTNWTIAPCPTDSWAALVYPDLEPEAAYARLWDQLRHVLRLDEADPVAAWRERMGTVVAAADRLTERRLDALHFEGPGTEHKVGEHHPNLPTEETFTTPDPERVEGVVRATKPLALPGTIIRGLEVEFRGGRAARIDAESGADALRALCERDEGAARLGEVALVDREGRIGPLDTVFFDTLIDENAASHIALGRAYEMALDDDADKQRANLSAIHIDFMIGSPEMQVTGVTGDGERTPVLRDGAWAH